nr:MAG TPA: Structural Protein [Caudoviricetes sp.]
MSINAIYSSTPRIILTGIQDLSTRVVPLEPEQLPQHLPLFYTFARRGGEEATIVTGGTMGQVYGEETFMYSSKYATHVTPFLNGLAEEGNMMMVKRLKPKGAKTAWIRFSLAVRKEKEVDPDTNKETGKEIYKLYWFSKLTDNNSILTNTTIGKVVREANRFGKGLTIHDKELGLLTDGASGASSSISATGAVLGEAYPIFDLEVTDFGEYGNNMGLRLFAPNNRDDSNRPDMRFYNSTLARVFRVEFIHRENRRASARSVLNNYGEVYTDFVFKPDTVNANAGDADMYIGTMLIDQYRQTDTSRGRIAKYGPFNRVYVYEENIEHILRTLFEAEKERDAEIPEIVQSGTDSSGNPILVQNPFRKRIHNPNDDDAFWQIDFFNGYNIEGDKYQSFKVEGMRGGGVDLTATTDHWADGGSDGDMGNHEYNKLVYEELAKFENGDSYEMSNMARYPFSVFYDTGFPTEVATNKERNELRGSKDIWFPNVKKQISKLLIARKDISVCLATHEVDPENREYRVGVVPLIRKDEATRISAITTYPRAYLESEVHGTKAVRANLIMQCGRIIGSQYRGLVPMTYELALKRARFMGAANGRMNSGYGYDQDGVKQLQYVKEVNNPFVPYVAREVNWTNGASWAEPYDRHTMFFPAVRTIYRDETSVLVSDINMLIAVDLQKVCFRTWRRLVGDSKLTNAQFIERSDNLILEDVDGRYDGRVVIKPETFYTKGDEARGYSWNCRIHMYANNMKTVGVYTVVTHRQSELEGK